MYFTSTILCFLVLCVLCVVETDPSRRSQVLLTVSKPGETADVPVGVIVGSVIGGLLLLALAVGLLWKVTICFQPGYFRAYGMQNCIQFHASGLRLLINSVVP